MSDVELFDGMEFALPSDVPPVSVMGGLDPQLQRANATPPSDSILRVLHTELGSALCWLDGVSVQLSFYQAAPLFLSEPRQRAKLIGYVAACARRFRELGSDELFVSWRDEPALIAAEGLRLRRTPGAARLIVERLVAAGLEAAR
jgi:hypothetical protein